MKIYRNKDNHLTIVYGPNEEEAGITIVKDRGPGKITNMFGNRSERFIYHWTNLYAGHTTTTRKLSNILGETDKRYLLKRSKQK